MCTNAYEIQQKNQEPDVEGILCCCGVLGCREELDPWLKIPPSPISESPKEEPYPINSLRRLFFTNAGPETSGSGCTLAKSCVAPAATCATLADFEDRMG